MEVQRTEERMEVQNGLSETSRNILFSRTVQVLSQGLDLEERGLLEDAVASYVRGLDMLMELIQQEKSEPRKDLLRLKFKEFLQKAESTKAKMSQLSTTSTINNHVMCQEEPKQQQIATNTTMEVEQPTLEKLEEEMECTPLLNIEGVQCFSIVSNTKELIESGALQILSCGTTLTFLKIGEFEFPLTKSIPCLKIAKGNYVLPMTENIFYGFIFPTAIPDQYLKIFESLMEKFCTFRESKADEESTLSTANQSNQIITQTPQDRTSTALYKVANGIDVGSKYLVNGIEVGSEYLSTGVAKGAQLLKSKVVPNEVPSVISPKLAHTVHVAKVVSPYAVKLTKGVVQGMVLLAEQVGNVVGGKLAETELGKKFANSKPSPQMEAAVTVGKTSIAAVINIWDSLETAGKKLLTNTKEATVEVVDHKYGHDASKFVDDATSVALDAVETMYQAKQATTKKLAKRMALHTGKQTAVHLLTPAEEMQLLDDKPNNTQ